MPETNPTTWSSSSACPSDWLSWSCVITTGIYPKKKQQSSASGLAGAAARDWFVQLGVQSQSLAEVLAPQYSEEDEPTPEQLSAMEDRAHAELLIFSGRSNR